MYVSFTQHFVKCVHDFYSTLCHLQSVYMSFTQHFVAISRVFSHFMHICSFLQYEYFEIGNVSMGFSKSLMPKIPCKSLVFDSWFDRTFGIVIWKTPYCGGLTFIVTFSRIDLLRSVTSCVNNNTKSCWSAYRINWSVEYRHSTWTHVSS